ncbi:MAG: TRAP transporter large permease subunit, partial [Caldimonas sp.]
WVAGLLDRLPGGATGLLLMVSALVFVLGFFLDFFEIAFILVPLLAPAAEALGIDLIWLGVLLAVNLQTSFLTPPFGYALFFLRGVAPADDRIDPATGRVARGLGTGEIYRGVLPFVAVQLLVMSALIAFPQLVRVESSRTQRLDEEAVNEILRRSGGSVGQLPAGDPAVLLEERMQREREGR